MRDCQQYFEFDGSADSPPAAGEKAKSRDTLPKLIREAPSLAHKLALSVFGPEMLSASRLMVLGRVLELIEAAPPEDVALAFRKVRPEIDESYIRDGSDLKSALCRAFMDGIAIEFLEAQRTNKWDEIEEFIQAKKRGWPSVQDPERMRLLTIADSQSKGGLPPVSFGVLVRAMGYRLVDGGRMLQKGNTQRYVKDLREKAKGCGVRIAESKRGRKLGKSGNDSP